MTAIILAAGLSKRFGRQKLLTELNGKPLIRYVIDTVLQCGFDEVILVCRHTAVKRLVKGENIKIAHNNYAAQGISTSVRCGVLNARPTDAYMFFTGDQPYVRSDTVAKLKKAYYTGKGTIIVPRYANNNGNPVLFACEWKESLLALTGDTGGKTIIRENKDKVYYVAVDDPLGAMDIDTPEDYKRLAATAETERKDGYEG